MESKEACELFCPECILFFHGQISNGCCYINLGLKQMRLNSLLVWDIITVCLEQTFIANQQNKHLQTLYNKATDFSISITWEEKSSLSCKYWQWLGCLDYGRWLINLTVQAYQQESRNTKERNNLIKKKGIFFQDKHTFERSISYVAESLKVSSACYGRIVLFSSSQAYHTFNKSVLKANGPTCF